MIVYVLIAILYTPKGMIYDALPVFDKMNCEKMRQKIEQEVSTQDDLKIVTECLERPLK